MKDGQIRELENGLKEVTELLNKNRGLWDRYIVGQEYLFEKNEEGVNPKFIITTTYRNKRTGLCADVEILDEHLSGLITPMKSAKSVTDFLHSFSHRYNISLGILAFALEPNYF